VDTPGLEWTVITWNIQGSKPTDLARLCAVIAAEGPDVVVLQEVQRRQARKLASGLSMQHSWVEKHNPWRPVLPRRAEGAAILTPHFLEDPDSAVISEETSKRSYKRRIAMWALVRRCDGSAYRVINGHLSPHNLTQHRRDEAKRIATIAQDLGDSPPTIVAGDFDDAGDPSIISTLPGIEALPAPLSNPAGTPYQAIDHVLVPADAISVSVSAPGGSARWANLSDHLPVTVRFALDRVQDEVAG
jgi:endonuclease/exonuclease/phosphatase family metal-dependent hydrolase